MTEKTSYLTPTSATERILSLDVLRGFAVLGILIMNIQNFSMIEAAYLNPLAYGDLTGINQWTWILSHIFGDQKFMTIFSILFGAGIVLFTNRADAKGRNVASLHYRRTLWLFVIGMMHAYLLWHGDILVSYSLCALLVFLFRKSAPKKLLIIGMIFISLSSILYLLFGWSMQFWPPDAIEGNMAGWMPGAEMIEKELTAMQGSWLEQMPHRVISSLKFQTFIFLIWTGWRAGGLMLVGMALFKWGVLTAQRSNRFYRIAMIVGFGIGLPMVSFGVDQNFAADWAMEFSMFFGWQYNYWGSLLFSLGYIGLVMLICKAESLQKITRPFAAVGRMAFSNYLLQTVICTTIFYGHGLGLFGKAERWQQVLIMAGIWIVQLMISPIWLRYFRFGPMEWLWRSLTYWKVQPMISNSKLISITQPD